MSNSIVLRYGAAGIEMPRNRTSASPGKASLGGARYHALFENMSEGIVVAEAILGPDGQLADYWVRAANPVFLRRAPLGDVMLNRRQLDVRPDTSRSWFEACARALAGEFVRFEFQDRLNSRWYEAHMARLSATEFAQFFVDITERKTAEERLVQLFGELNHRVKNNLAIASSILELQARSSPPEVREHLRKAIDRLRSIGDLHIALYQQNSTEAADLQRYLQELCERLSHSLFEDRLIQISVDCEPVDAPAEQAVSLGLIVNELVTNAAKHAFAPGATGAIRVTLAAADDELDLTVADTGCGLPALRQDRTDGGLGLRLVRSLADGLGGELQLDPGPGAVFHLRLPRRKLATATTVQPRLL